jgi:hypothetical protein
MHKCKQWPATAAARHEQRADEASVLKFAKQHRFVKLSADQHEQSVEAWQSFEAQRTNTDSQPQEFP